MFNKTQIMLIIFYLLQLVIASYLINKFKFPKGYLFLAILFSYIANLYFLVYGIFRQNKALDNI